MAEERRPALPEARYGLNVARWLKDHPDHTIAAGPFGEGFVAHRKDDCSRGTGPPVCALTLDELAGKLAGQDVL
jgi:hypothetical protein